MRTLARRIWIPSPIIVPSLAVSFLIPVFNRSDLTRRFLDNLRTTVPGDDWEALVIDDGSTDDTPDLLARLHAPFRVVRRPENGGFAAAINTGAQGAQGAVWCLLNNDLALRPGWLEPMQRLLAHESDAGAVGNIQLNPRTGLVDHAGIFFDLEGMPAHAHKNRRHPPSGPARERNACTAACMLVRPAAFKKVGGFTPEFRNGMEDVDFCVRLKNAGYRIFVSHESIVEHEPGQSPGRHDYNDANRDSFRRRCAATTAVWGRQEWPSEYFRRYARKWWRMHPALAARALMLLIWPGESREKKSIA